MRSSTNEPSERAALVASRGVSAAEKRAEYAARGEEYPKYPDGTDMRWQKRERYVGGGRFLSWDVVRNGRARAQRERLLPGECSFSFCNSPRHQFTTGTYSHNCYEHGRESRKKSQFKRYWSDPLYRIEHSIKAQALKNQAKRRQLYGD